MADIPEINDKVMWKRLKRISHPDMSSEILGEEKANLLFKWLQEVEKTCNPLKGDSGYKPHTPQPEPFDFFRYAAEQMKWGDYAGKSGTTSSTGHFNMSEDYRQWADENDPDRIKLPWAYEPMLVMQDCRQRAVWSSNPKLKNALNLIGDVKMTDDESENMDGAFWKGATFKQLAKIGHEFGMNKWERGEFYGIAEELGVSQGHASKAMDLL